jgi:hypothetical protein
MVNSVPPGGGAGVGALNAGVACVVGAAPNVNAPAEAEGRVALPAPAGEVG